jgi:hypothetical protein
MRCCSAIFALSVAVPCRSFSSSCAQNTRHSSVQQRSGIARYWYISIINIINIISIIIIIAPA